MNQEFTLLMQTRQNVLSAIETLSDEQLNKVPTGFNNNIIWNVGHILVTQQLLCYKFSDLSMYVSEDLINKYKKGTKPEGSDSKEQIDLIKKELLTNSSKIKADYEKGIFKKFNAYTTSYGFALQNIEDAVKFNNTHEGLHYGYILALKHIV